MKIERVTQTGQKSEIRFDLSMSGHVMFIFTKSVAQTGDYFTEIVWGGDVRIRFSAPTLLGATSRAHSSANQIVFPIFVQDIFDFYPVWVTCVKGMNFA